MPGQHILSNPLWSWWGRGLSTAYPCGLLDDDGWRERRYRWSSSGLRGWSRNIWVQFILTAFRWVKQMNVIWILSVCAKSMSSTPPRQLLLCYSISSLVRPTGVSSTKGRLIRVSQVAARIFWCVETENPIRLWLLSVTHTIIQLLPGIKGTLLLVDQFNLLFLLLFLLWLFLPTPTCPPPLNTYFQDCIMKYSVNKFWARPPFIRCLYTQQCDLRWLN